MTVAEIKKRDNIAEYILFVWQMEDLARAAGFEPDAIKSLYEAAPEDQIKEEVEWFRALCRTMKAEDLGEKGHIPDVREVMQELAYLHTTLLTSLKDEKYQSLRADAHEDLRVFLEKAGGKASNEVDAYLTALYGFLILRLRGSEISEGTKESMEKFSKVVAYLSARYKKMKKGEMKSGLN